MMEEKSGRKKKYRMKTKYTEYFSFGISASYKLRQQQKLILEFSSFGLLLELFSVSSYWMPTYSGENAWQSQLLSELMPGYL